MKLIHVALTGCALSACAIDGDEGLATTTQLVRPAPDFESEMALDGGCGELIIFSNWLVSQTGSIDYTITDLTTGDGFLYTADLPPEGQTTDNNELFGVLDPVTGRPHRFLLDAVLKSESGATVYEDRFRTRFPCSFTVN